MHVFIFCFEKGSHCLAQVGLELLISYFSLPNAGIIGLGNNSWAESDFIDTT